MADGMLIDPAPGCRGAGGGGMAGLLGVSVLANRAWGLWIAREMHDEGVRMACCWIGIRERREVRQRWHIILTITALRAGRITGTKKGLEITT